MRAWVIASSNDGTLLPDQCVQVPLGLRPTMLCFLTFLPPAEFIMTPHHGTDSDAMQANDFSMNQTASGQHNA